MTEDGSRRAMAAGSAGALRIAIIPERYGRTLSPCASIRLQPYFDRMKREEGMDVRYLLPSELRRFGPQVIVWHRVSICNPADLETVRNVAAACGAKLLYDLDDNLLDLDDHGERGDYLSLRDSVRQALAMADEVWASTAMLGERVARETRASVQVLPNTLDPELWRLPRELPSAVRQGKQPLSIVYMGTRTHDADFDLLKEALDHLHRKRPGSFRLSTIGVRSADSALPAWHRSLTPPAHVGASYPAFVNWLTQLTGFELGVAPLLATAFNDCKSHIKVLDYAALGLPTLASAVPAYTHSLRHGIDCLHVANDARLWADTIGELTGSPATLASLAQSASSLVSPLCFAEGVSARALRIQLLSEGTPSPVQRPMPLDRPPTNGPS